MSGPVLPCSGLRVLDFGRGYAALTSMILADYGADVIRVEPRDRSDPVSMPAYRQWNRGKRLLVGDLHDGDDLAAVRGLAAESDVVVENFRPETAERLGIDWASLAASNPRLIHLSITGFGPSGRYANYKAYEGIVAAKCGQFVIQNGYRTDGPIYDAIAKGGFGAAMLGLIGVLAALRARAVTGAGQHVQTSLVQANSVYSYDGLRAENDATTARMSLVQGRDPHNDLPGYRIARCADGQWIQSGSYGPGIFENLMRGLGITEYFTDPRFSPGVWKLSDADRRALIELIDNAYLSRPLDEWTKILADHDAAYGVFLSTQEFLSYPQMVHNGHVIDVVDPVVGPMKQIGPLAAFAGSEWRWPGPAPDPSRRPEPPRWNRRDSEPSRSARPACAGAEPAVAAAGRDDGRAALDGLTVVDLAMWAAAPGGPGLLADLGARVIKVEPPSGDPTAATGGELFVRMTRSKRRVAIDLKQPDGQAALHALVAEADVVVHNFRPGVPERLGCDFQTLKAVNDRIVYVYAAAFGSSGPDSRRPAFDPVISALAGGEVLQAGTDNPPQQRQTADHAALLGVGAAILLGLRNRDGTGEAQYVETTMLGSAAYLFSDDFLWWEGKPERPRPDSGQHGLNALYRLYRASAGWVFLACLRPDEWERLCDAIMPSLRDESRFSTAAARRQHDHELATVLEDQFAGRPAAEWENHLQGRDVPCVVADQSWPTILFDDVGALAPDLVTRYDVPGIGSVRQIGSAVDLSATPARLGQLEELGQSTAEILDEVGFSADQIEDLASRGIVRVARDR
jgi:crotonobetainyl-CoA:carnitine CoA-transferase CaiB-like acyl-CoA transferase